MSQTSTNAVACPATLAEQVEAASSAFMAGLSPETRQIVGGAFGRLMASDAGDNAKRTGDAAPDFSLPRPDGGRLALSQLLAQGPVVLSFYRGGWCPFCSLEFKALLDILPEIGALGARLLGVAPETPEAALRTVDRHGLAFDVLCDVGNEVAREYGLLMSVDEAMRALYVQWGMDLPGANGDDSYELPLPATYIIDAHGVIQADFVDKNYTQRMEPAAILAALHALPR